MPELQPTRLSTQLRRATLAMACLLPLCGLPAGVLAQDVPAGLRACAAESDPGQRLDCYDREMQRLAAPATPTLPARPAKPTSPAPPAEPALPATAAQPAPPVAARAAQSAAPHRTPAWKKIFGGGGSSQVTARVARLERSPDTMVIHLDNGQVWRQVGRASGALTLHTGDEVTIDEHLGSYWLSARYISDMKVRQAPQ